MTRIALIESYSIYCFNIENEKGDPIFKINFERNRKPIQNKRSRIK